MYDDKQFYLLSARQMLEFDLQGRDVMNMDILGPDVKPTQVRASSNQRDLCLFAATGEGEQASACISIIIQRDLALWDKLSILTEIRIH